MQLLTLISEKVRKIIVAIKATLSYNKKCLYDKTEGFFPQFGCHLWVHLVQVKAMSIATTKKKIKKLGCMSLLWLIDLTDGSYLKKNKFFFSDTKHKTSFLSFPAKLLLHEAPFTERRSWFFFHLCMHKCLSTARSRYMGKVGRYLFWLRKERTGLLQYKPIFTSCLMFLVNANGLRGEEAIATGEKKGKGIF